MYPGKPGERIYPVLIVEEVPPFNSHIKFVPAEHWEFFKKYIHNMEEFVSMSLTTYDAMIKLSEGQNMANKSLTKNKRVSLVVNIIKEVCQHQHQ